MEQYVGYAFLTILGLVLALLIKSITKMYERLWNSTNKKEQNPEELFIIMREAMNEANKRQEDRLRKRKPTTEAEEAVEPLHAEEGTPLDANTMEKRVQSLWEQYRELGGE